MVFFFLVEDNMHSWSDLELLNFVKKNLLYYQFYRTKFFFFFDLEWCIFDTVRIFFFGVQIGDSKFD